MNAIDSVFLFIICMAMLFMGLLMHSHAGMFGRLESDKQYQAAKCAPYAVEGATANTIVCNSPNGYKVIVIE